MYYTNSEGENGKRYFCKKQVSDFNLYFVANGISLYCLYFFSAYRIAKRMGQRLTMVRKSAFLFKIFVRCIYVFHFFNLTYPFTCISFVSSGISFPKWRRT